MSSVRVHIQKAPYWGHFKVFKVQSGYLCGVCRKSYSAEQQALACVKGCSSHSGHAQIDTLVRGIKTRFRCGFCYREYNDKQLASQCMGRCKSIVTERLVASRSAAPAAQHVVVVQDVSADVANAPSVDTTEVSETRDSENVTKFLQHAEETTQPSNIVVGDGDPNVIYREMNQKPFSRHNANYVCSACKNKFFTKAEVEACFESHPIRDPLIK